MGFQIAKIKELPNQKFSSKNSHFYSRGILQYIARTCLRNTFTFLPGVFFPLVTVITPLFEINLAKHI